MKLFIIVCYAITTWIIQDVINCILGWIDLILKLAALYDNVLSIMQLDNHINPFRINDLIHCLSEIKYL